MTRARSFAAEIVEYRGHAHGARGTDSEAFLAVNVLNRGLRDLLRPPRDNPLFEKWLARIRVTCHIKRPRDCLVSPGKPSELWLRTVTSHLTLYRRGWTNSELQVR
jgi:hypothetical protein